MCSSGRVPHAFAGWILVLATACLPSLAAAQDACQSWNVSNEWSAIQSNGTNAHFVLQQDATVLKGTAHYAYLSGGDAFTGDDAHLVDGSVDGTVKGDTFNVTVYWNNGTIGAYTGQIGPQGRIEGSTYDKQHPQTIATWHSDGLAECADVAQGTSSPGLATSAKPTVALGRAAPRSGSPTLSVCDAAMSARARNSPAAPGLERQCAAQSATPVASPQVAAEPGPRLDDAWRNEKSARGQALAGEDPLATELRNAIPEGKPRNGFDYGMAVAEGQTANGPGKNAVRDALDRDEQLGFELAVQFSVDRNAHAALATTGASIAQVDPDVARLRAGGDALAQVQAPDAPPFYKLGFDIATGLFGDPALGAAGNTAAGPGSQKIRNSLAPGAEQSGFDDAMAFHLARHLNR